MNLRWSVGSLLLLVMLVLVGCGETSIESADEGGSDSGGSSDTTEQEDGNSDDSQEEEEAKMETYSVGDTVQFDDMKITLSKVREVPAGEYSSPENDKFLAVELALENTGEQEISASTMMNMSLLSAEGYEQSQSFMADTKGNLDTTIGPGRSVKGEVAFDVEESEYYEFIFEDPFKSGQAIWKIESSQIQ